MATKFIPFEQVEELATIEGLAEKPDDRRQSASTFDPAAFAQKLEWEYTDEVQALGIGFYRGKLYQALRYEDGSCAGYSAISGEIKLPTKLLPQVHNVVAFSKRA